MRICLPVLFISLSLMFLHSLKIQAQSYEGSSNVQLLHGKNLSTLTLEHAGRYRSFAQFGFADLFHVSESGGIDVYTEWYPKISIVSFDKDKFLKEIFLGAGVNALVGKEFVVGLAGPVWQFNVPSFNLFQLETYYYRQLNDKTHKYNGTYQLTYSWSLPVALSNKWKLLSRGFLDYIGDRGPGTYQIVTQPQLLLDIGNLWNKSGRFYTGTEWNYWKNINGNAAAKRSILQLELIYFLK